jgi:hypothetical protein
MNDPFTVVSTFDVRPDPPGGVLIVHPRDLWGHGTNGTEQVTWRHRIGVSPRLRK